MARLRAIVLALSSVALWSATAPAGEIVVLDPNGGQPTAIDPFDRNAAPSAPPQGNQANLQRSLDSSRGYADPASQSGDVQIISPSGRSDIIVIPPNQTPVERNTDRARAFANPSAASQTPPTVVVVVPQGAQGNLPAPAPNDAAAVLLRNRLRARANANGPQQQPSNSTVVVVVPNNTSPSGITDNNAAQLQSNTEKAREYLQGEGSSRCPTSVVVIGGIAGVSGQDPRIVSGGERVNTASDCH